MASVVYLKTFDNGSVYVGKAKNFKNRMREHKYRAFKQKYISPLYNTFRKYNHITEILMEFEDDNDALKYEQIIISNFRDLGYEVLNLTNGGEGTVGYTHSEDTKKKIGDKRRGHKHTEETKSRISELNKGVKLSEEHKEKISKSKKGKVLGDKNPNAKPKEYYETNSVLRENFKTTCKRMGWNDNDFIEVFAEWYYKPDVSRKRKFYYIYQGGTQ